MSTPPTRKEVSDAVAWVVAEAITDGLGSVSDLKDVEALPSDGVVTNGFVIVANTGDRFAVMVHNFNEPRDRATVIAHTLLHTLSTWKPLRASTVAWAAQCIDCGRVALVHKVGTISGPALREKCWIDARITDGRQDHV